MKVFNPTDLLKAKKMPIGTVSKGRKKVAEGEWRDVKKGASKTGAKVSVDPKYKLMVAAREKFAAHMETMARTVGIGTNTYKYGMEKLAEMDAFIAKAGKAKLVKPKKVTSKPTTKMSVKKKATSVLKTDADFINAGYKKNDDGVWMQSLDSKKSQKAQDKMLRDRAKG